MDLPVSSFIVLLFSSSLISILIADDQSIFLDKVNKQDLSEHDLQDELISLLEESVQGGVPGVSRKRAHSKGPAPVTRVLNQVKMSKLADRRRGNNRGGSKSGGGHNEYDEDTQIDSTTIEPSSIGVDGESGPTTRSPRHRYRPSTPDLAVKELEALSGSVAKKPTAMPPSVLPINTTTSPPTSLIFETPRHFRLQKLDYYFAQLGVFSEDCRKRLLCEVAEDHTSFQPLSFVLHEETSFTGDYQHVTSEMMNTIEGARLLSYMEATLNGQDRTRGCSVFKYRCPSGARDMINYDALVLWREMIRWLSVQVVARTTP